MKTSDKNLDITAIENIELRRTLFVDNKLFGEWTVHLSCDGSVMCNVCPKMSFRSDGFGVTTNGVGTVQNFKWETKGDKLEISNFTIDNIVDNGEYAIIYRTHKDTIELELINSTNSDCYKFTRVTSN